jgi:F-type H+-transporting ATPase subunit gamma
MLSTRLIKRRIRSVRSIDRITSALQMVAAARLRKVQQKVESGRVYADKMREIMQRLASQATGVEHPLLEVREVVRPALVVMSASRGLCGSYTGNIHRRAQAHLDEMAAHGLQPAVVTVGRKAKEFFSRRGYEVVESYDRLSAESPHAEVRVAAEVLRKMYGERRVDRVEVAYTQFVSVGRHVPTIAQLLPVPRPAGADNGAIDYIFEPPPALLFPLLLPRYVDIVFQYFLFQATASEHAARAMAMSQASDNAEEMIESLTLQYNKSRQAAITAELLDVVGGAEALKG